MDPAIESFIKNYVASLTPSEANAYEAIFRHVDVDGDRKVSAGEVKYLQKAHVPGAVLKEVWRLSSVTKNTFLFQLEFYLALGLIAAHQAGLPVAYQSLTSSGFSKVPKFDDPTLQLPQEQLQAPHQSFGVQQATTPLTTSLAPSVTLHASSQPPSVSAHPPPVAVSLQEIPIPTVTIADQGTYASQFQMLDQAKLGFVPGEIAREIFLKSGLTEDVLEQIWNIADLDADNKLDKFEYTLAMHLIKFKRQNATAVIPKALPANLVPPTKKDAWTKNFVNSEEGLAVQMTGDKFAGLGVIAKGRTRNNSKPIRRNPFSDGADTIRATLAAQQPQPAAIQTHAGPSQPASLSSSMSQSFRPANYDHSVFSGVSLDAEATVDWSVSPTEQAKAVEMFKSLDANGSGQVTFSQMADVFNKLKISEIVSRLVLDLADIDKNGALDAPEFVVALTLCHKAKNGVTIPKVLPPALVPQSKAALYASMRRKSFTHGSAQMPPAQHIYQNPVQQQSFPAAAAFPEQGFSQSQFHTQPATPLTSDPTGFSGGPAQAPIQSAEIPTMHTDPFVNNPNDLFGTTQHAFPPTQDLGSHQFASNFTPTAAAAPLQAFNNTATPSDFGSDPFATAAPFSGSAPGFTLATPPPQSQAKPSAAPASDPFASAQTGGDLFGGKPASDPFSSFSSGDAFSSTPFPAQIHTEQPPVQPHPAVEEITHLEEKSNTLKTEMNALRVQVAEEQTKQANLEERKRDLQMEVEKLEKQKASELEFVKKLERDNQLLAASIEILGNDVAALQAEIRELQSKQQQASTHKSHLESKKSELQSTTESLSAQKQSLVSSKVEVAPASISAPAPAKQDASFDFGGGNDFFAPTSTSTSQAASPVSAAAPTKQEASFDFGGGNDFFGNSQSSFGEATPQAASPISAPAPTKQEASFDFGGGNDFFAPTSTSTPQVASPVSAPAPAPAPAPTKQDASFDFGGGNDFFAPTSTSTPQAASPVSAAAPTKQEASFDFGGGNDFFAPTSTSTPQAASPVSAPAPAKQEASFDFGGGNDFFGNSQSSFEESGNTTQPTSTGAPSSDFFSSNWDSVPASSSIAQPSSATTAPQQDMFGGESSGFSEWSNFGALPAAPTDSAAETPFDLEQEFSGFDDTGFEDF